MNYQATDNVVTAVFCTHKSALEILRHSHYVLVIDATHKTNRYNMPIVNIEGITPSIRPFLWALDSPRVKKSHFIGSFFGICMTFTTN